VFLTMIGFVIGVIGTLIGAGGGFMLVPILLFIFPHWTPERVTGLSMITVAQNAISGSIAYYYQKKIHLKSGLLFSLAGIPGALLGVLLTHYVNKTLFEKIFGFALILYAIILLLKKMKDNQTGGSIHEFSPQPKSYVVGFWLSLVIGFVASFLGIGGGVIHVPLLSLVLGFPVHIATGTSHFILSFTAIFASAVHLYQGDLSLFDKEVWQLGLGAICGAQLGAHFSKRVPGKLILKILAVALLGVGIRLLVKA
jgi:uncharacterized protein